MNCKKSILLNAVTKELKIKQFLIGISLLFFVLQINAQSSSLEDDNRCHLQIAKVTLVTGNDNKDKGADLGITMHVNDGRKYQFMGYWLKGYTNEIKKWQWWTFDMPRSIKFENENNTLAMYKKYGLALEIWYDSYGGPFPLTDAWKVDKIYLDIGFTNVVGEAHPKYGNFRIEIPNSSVLFTKRTCYIKITTDGNFKAQSPIHVEYCNF